MNRILYGVAILSLIISILFLISIYSVLISPVEISNVPPKAVISISGSMYVGSEIVFDASNSSDDRSIEGYLWEFSDKTVLRGMKVKRIFELPGNYSVNLIVWDDRGFYSKSSKTFEIFERLASVQEILDNPQKYLGKKIRARGVFVDGYPYNFYVCEPDGYRCIKVYAERGSERPVSIFPCDLLEIVGEVTIYKGELEVLVKNVSGYYIRIIGKGKTSYMSVNSNLLNESFFEKYNHTLIHTSNLTVLSFYSGKNVTILNTDRIKIVGFPGSNITFDVRKKIEVFGFLTYYNGHEIKIRPGTTDRVLLTESVIENYANISVDELNIDPERYNNTLVHLSACRVVQVSRHYLFKVADQNGSSNITVYVEPEGVAPLLVSPDDIVDVWGLFTRYQTLWEIKIRAKTQDKIILLNTSYKRVNTSYVHVLDSNGMPVYINETVEIIGNVTAILSRTKIYIQDSAGGVAIYGLNFSAINLSIGDRVCFRGYIYTYYGEEEIVVRYYYHYRKLGRGEIYILNVSTGDIWKYEGNLVRVVGVVKEIYTSSSFYTITIDDGSGPCKVFIWVSSGINISFIGVGDKLMVVGIVSQYDKTLPYTSNHELIPRMQEDIVEVSKLE